LFEKLGAISLADMLAAMRMVFVFLVLGAPAALVGIPWSALRGNFSTMYRWGMAVIRLGVKAAGIRVRVEGMENVPVGESCIFLSNHVSNLDPPVLLPVIPGMTSVFLKKSLMKIPLLGTAMRMGKFVPVTRGGSREEAAMSVAAAADALKSGLHITVFPEGTRSLDGNLLPFKKGAFFLAAETGAPMVPIVIRGTAQMMRKGSLKLYPGEAVVSFLPALRPENFASREDLMEAVRAEMEAALAGS
jgi:1-acyl-sn-glycerol-3-phosphate acyltransferase